MSTHRQSVTEYGRFHGGYTSVKGWSVTVSRSFQSTLFSGLTAGSITAQHPDYRLGINMQSTGTHYDERRP
jgi:hypothetical protein